MKRFHTLLVKEIKEILREKHSLLMMSIVSILIGPIVLIFISNMLAGFEARAERRVVLIDGIENSELIINHFKRQTATVLPAPENYEYKIKKHILKDPVLVIPEDFDQQWLSSWQTDQPVTLTIVSDASNGATQAGARRIIRWLNGFSKQRIALNYLQKGIKPNLPSIIEIREKNLNNPKASFAKLFTMLPYFFILASFYATWAIALDSSIGEKERNTLIPLTLTKANIKEIVIAKWLAISLLGACVCSLAALSFIPAQSLMAGETIKTMFSFGWKEAVVCAAAVVPLCFLFVVGLLWIGFNAKSTKSAQSQSTLLMLVVSLLPLFMSVNENQKFSYFPVISSHHSIITMLKGDAYQIILMFSIAINLSIALLLLFALINQCNRKLITD